MFGIGGKKMLSLSFKNNDELYQSYMPFIENGGLFIETERNYEIGDEVFMLVTLPESEKKNPVAGTVVWVTPPGAGGHPAGVGIQFNDQDKGQLRNIITSQLDKMLESDLPTQTM